VASAARFGIMQFNIKWLLRRAGLACLLITSLIFAGCSGSDDPVAPPVETTITPPETPPETPPTPPPSVQAGIYDSTVVEGQMILNS
jgi:hypothetical protein